MNSAPLQTKTIDFIFMHLHGRFGNTFFNKFRIGETTEDGKDKGIENAKRVWASRLGGMSKERLKNALDHTYDSTPSLDDFVMNCRVQVQHEDHKALPKKISDEEFEKAQEKLQEIQNKFNNKPTRDWVAHWKNLSANSTDLPNISLRSAEQALINLRQA